MVLHFTASRETLPSMVSRSKPLVIAVVFVIMIVAAAAVVLRDRMRCAGFPGPGVLSGEVPGVPPGDGNLRFVSWNVRNFPIDERPEDPELGYSRRTNICDLEEVLAGLDGDVLVLQEVNDTRRFPPILRRASGDRKMGVRFSAGGGRFGQHLAIAWDVEALELVDEPVDVTDTVFEEGMRPAFAAYLRSRRPSGLDFTVVVVHHESGPRNFGDRRRQNRALADWIKGWVEEVDDPDVVVLGDFNTTGSPRGGFEGELQSMDSILGSAGLQRLPNVTGCSSYWEGGGDPDGVQHPSLLDHVFLSGFGDDAVARPLEAWLHCARFECSELVSRPGAEDGTFWDVSDHCPLTFELRDRDVSP